MKIDKIVNNIEYIEEFEYAKNILLKNYRWLYSSSDSIDIAIGGILVDRKGRMTSYIYNRDGVVFHIDRKYILGKIDRYIGLRFIDMLLYRKYDIEFRSIGNIRFIYRYILMKLNSFYKRIRYKNKRLFDLHFRKK